MIDQHHVLRGTSGLLSKIFFWMDAQLFYAIYSLELAVQWLVVAITQFPNQCFYLIRLHTISGDSTDYQIDLSGTGTSCPDHAAICRLDKSQVIKTTLGVMEGQQFYIEGQ